jgi:hypothetical protein
MAKWSSALPLPKENENVSVSIIFFSFLLNKD